MAQNDGLAGNPSIAIWPQNAFQWQLFTQQLYTTNLQSGMSAYLTGQPGYFLGYAKNVVGIPDGTPVFSVGNPSGHYMAWNGSTLTVVGNITVLGGIISDGVYLGSGTGPVIYNVRQSTAVTPDVNGNYVKNFSTSQGLDDFGWSTTATYGNITSIPAGVQAAAAAGTVQSNLGTAGAPGYILSQTGGGANAWIPQYGLNFNSAYNQPGSTTLTNAFALIGTLTRLPNPQSNCNIYAIVTCKVHQSGAVTVAYSNQIQLGISTDGGATYTYGNIIEADFEFLGAALLSMSAMAALTNVTPTGDVVVQLQGQYSAGAGGTCSLQAPQIMVFMMPVANFSIVTGALAVSVPGTETSSCYATYPTTTCAATQSITATPTGGTPPYTYSWSRTGGTGAGAIISGATAITCNVSGTKTGTVGGTSYTDTYKCIVTDHVSANANASCTVTSTYYLLYSAISPSMTALGGNCIHLGGTCSASGSFSVSATGGNGNYTYSNSIYSQSLSGATILSGATAATGTFGGIYAVGNSNYIVLQTTVNDTIFTGNQTTNSNQVKLNYVDST